MKKILFFVFTLISIQSFSQKTENIFLITSDGLRWQDVFAGADSAIIFNKVFTPDSAEIVKEFWDKSAQNRREILMPFLWKTLTKEGQIYGNRWKGNFMDVDNIYRFSYPGYNELLTGFADVEINSNDKNYNKNVTVLEYLNKQPKFKGKVAAFSTWDVFPYIINDKRSGIPVNSGRELVEGKLSPKQELLNEIQLLAPHAKAERHDFITYFQAKEYVALNKPKVMFISFDDTDGYAHAGKYKEYLQSAHAFDKYLSDLWNYCQSQPEYKDKTTFIITTDHGRGDRDKSEWTSHGQRIRDAAQIWMAVIGPDTPATGEIATKQNLFQNQIAKTLADLLGYNFENGKEIGKEIESVK
ncbi:phosphoglyceromutase [Lacihabitans sp. CCS-44]|uniref:alkaline phosphatase family protein n=1 Tax=Lacihabitans sp. CCS-44 TaxID=2487331 RepID=UPI0020CEA18F|nr:alkaline phosphatase family protein [Lacihabitans sp. CCS-44]MCP9757313.1 phosphoglyceromutase [Lacihabitans sp. CCS-44]